MASNASTGSDQQAEPASGPAEPTLPPSTAAPVRATAQKATAAKKAPRTGAASTIPPAAKRPSARKATVVTKTTEHPPVPAGTDWSASELADVRTELVTQLAELKAEYEHAIAELNDMQNFARDGAGDDQADTGTKTFEREQELSIAHNRLDLLTQVERAIERINAGTYGICEGCGKPIAKARLQAFPGATLCVECKQREERR